MGATKKNRDRHTKEAIRLAGGTTALADYFEISTQAVSQWKRIPADKVLDIVELINDQVTAAQLCPRLYGRKVKATREKTNGKKNN